MTRVSQVLHDAGAAAWHAAVSHPMVLAIADGSLPHATFHRYFTQNVLYLEDYARAIGLIMAKAPDRDAIDGADEVPVPDRRDRDPGEPVVPRSPRR